MSGGAPDARELDALSREAVVVCGDDGVVRWADERATRRLGVSAGARLADVALDGSREKVAAFLADARARGDAVRGWELQLATPDGPRTASCRARPRGGDELLVVLSLVPDDYATLLAETGQTMTELSRLHRETERQSREILAGRAEILRLGGDLRDSSRGITALYDELSETNESLRAARESRTRLLADMGHELRTPLASIIGLSKLLASGIDGTLSQEQERQVGFIRRSADEMLELVNDLLDLSRLDAGKLRFRPAEFTVETLFGMLRGQLRPLASTSAVELTFEDLTDGAPLSTDENKVAQVLRNYISNALKFTERGSVHVMARPDGEGAVLFTVTDTGVGIAPADHERVWEEFTQLDGPVQQRTRGTGLGLSLVRRLAEVLEGSVGLESEPGRGSTFWLRVPTVHPDVVSLADLRERAAHAPPGTAPVLVVEDDPQSLFLYERYLQGSGFQVVPARSIAEARAFLAHTCPSAIVLDVMLDGETSWQFLEEVKRDASTCDVPTLVVTVLDRERKARALGADEFYVKPLSQEWLLRKLRSLAGHRPVHKVLVVDDDEVARYLVRRLLADTTYQLLEAADGPQGIAIAHEQRPDVILLDFVLPSMTAFDVLDQLKLDPDTRTIPVIVSTSRQLEPEERMRLSQETTAIITKDRLSREVAITRIREALQLAMGSSGRAPAGVGAESA